MAAAALRGVRGCSPWVVALSKGGGPQASIRRCASGGGGGVRWDGGISSTTKHKRFQRQGHRAIVPEAFVHRPVVQTVETSDGQVVINGNPVSRLYTQKARARGFATDNMVKHFQHRLRLRVSGQHVYGEVDRPDGTSIVTASTLEWAVRRHLYSGADKTACASVGAVMAARLKESGLTSVFFDRQGAGYHGKVKSFIDAVVENGISLKE
eukprot:m.71902 g.71902  ORF g.71902 m.71902 type:complete len:210 (+) comp18678_c0_seq1:269-898(+)